MCIRDRQWTVDSGQLTVKYRLSQLSTVNCQLSTKKVGVFVNATIESMMEKASAYKLDYLQLHGNESPEDCHTLQKRGYSLIKAFPIATKEDFEKTREYEGRVDYFLFDTRCEGYGGSGKRFDWSILTAVSYTHLDVYKRQVALRTTQKVVRNEDSYVYINTT